MQYIRIHVAKNYVETFFPGHFTAIIHFGLIKLILCQYFLFLSVDTLQSRDKYLLVFKMKVGIVTCSQ